MTREEAKQLLPIIQAWAEGETIEIYYRKDKEWSTMTIEDPSFDCGPSCYRIKPKPKYRPFKSQEECWNEMLKHQPFGWLKTKSNGTAIFIDSVCSNKSVWIALATDETSSYSASKIFNDYVFADGTPFGIKKN